MTCKNPVEEIVVDFIYETESEDGDKTTHAYALDGRILWITKPNPTKLAELKKAEMMLREPKLNRKIYEPTDDQNPRQEELNRKQPMFAKYAKITTAGHVHAIGQTEARGSSRRGKGNRFAT